MTLSRGTQARIRAGIWLVLLAALIVLAFTTLTSCGPIQSVDPGGADNMPGTSGEWAADGAIRVTTNKPFSRVFYQTDNRELGVDGENPGSVVTIEKDSATMWSPKDIQGKGIELSYETQGGRITFAADELGAEITPAIAAAQESLTKAQGWVDRIVEAQMARDQAAAAVAVEGIRAALEAASNALVPIP